MKSAAFNSAESDDLVPQVPEMMARVLEDNAEKVGCMVDVVASAEGLPVGSAVSSPSAR